MIIKGDLLKSKEDVVAHQVNAIGVMGAGIALQLRRKYPEVYTEYQMFLGELNNKEEAMGTCQIVKVNNTPNSPTKYVANLFGQLGVGRNQKQTDYEMLLQSLVDLFQFAKSNNLSVALPYNLGCGLAGGDWSFVSKLIKDAADGYPYTLYKYN